MNRIGDLHCDLLMFLVTDPFKSAHNEKSRCSLKQMKEGKVSFQTLAIFTLTQPGSSEVGFNEFNDYLQLPQRYPQECEFRILPTSDKVQLSYAIENASGFAEEKENLEQAFERLDHMIKAAGSPLYISMTWREENRFGGGDEVQGVGLKQDGEELLRFIDGKNIAIDLSHTSDALAYDILNFIDAHSLNITPIASHSNFRSVASVPRNLPDELAVEISKRGGIIGLNFVSHFIGKKFEDISKHINHAQKLGILDSLAFGADFFDDSLLSNKSKYLGPYFHKGFENSSCYPKVTEMLLKEFSEDMVHRISIQNLANFLQRQER